MAQTLEQIRQLIRTDTAELAALAAQHSKVEKRRDARVKRARAMGATSAEIGADMGMTAGRVRQMAPGGKPGRPRKVKAEPAAPAPAPEGEPPADDGTRPPVPEAELPETFHAGAAVGIKRLLHADGLVSNGWHKDRPELVTVFLDMGTGVWVSPDGHRGQVQWRAVTAAEILQQLPVPVERVYLCGPRAQDPSVSDPAEAARAWILAPVDGWEADRHFLAEPARPVGRWKHTESGRSVEMHRAATWFGDGGNDWPGACAEAWSLLRRAIAGPEKRGGFGEGAILMSTPATTGRDLWRRSIGIDGDGRPKEYPVLSDELRQLIQSTSPQGRREVISEGPQRIGTFTQYDIRFAYSALAWGLPVGAPTMVTGQQFREQSEQDQDLTLFRRGRWLVRATVPAGWEHVGLLGTHAAGPGRTWTYPRRPGQTFTTWASGSEVKLAQRQGWGLDVVEGFTFKEEKPLNTWAERLISLYTSAQNSPNIAPDIKRLIRKALRLMVLTAIGAFASKVHPVTKSLEMNRENQRHLPDHYPVRVVGDMWVWEEPGERSEWMRRLDQPAWAAEVWARCRGRLLDSGTAVAGVRAGALHVPPGAVLGMRTDALYLACDPGWPDDGKVGRYRLEGRITGDMARPQTEAEIDDLRAASAAALDKEGAA